MKKRNEFTDEHGQVVSLRDPLTAGVLAWLLPGLGHWYQGRRSKAILYCVCILGTFVYGCYLGGNSSVGYARVVYASFRPGDSRLAYLCQVGVGLPALPALIQSARVRNNKSPLLGGFMAPPRLAEDYADPPTLSRLQYELHTYFDLGTVYTMVAGLLNILVVFDAAMGPAFPPPEDRRREKEKQKAKIGEAKKHGKSPPGSAKASGTAGVSGKS